MLPRTLQRLVNDALLKVRAGPNHDLNSGHLYEIGKAVGWLAGVAHLGEASHRRRITLLILTARHVLPFWEQVHREDKTPHQLLEGLEQIKAGTLDPEGLRPALDQFDEMLAQEHMATQYEWHARNPNPGMYLMEAAHRASTVGAAISNGVTAIVDIDEELEEPGAANSSATTCVLMASDAYAGGMAKNRLSDSAKRLAFWEWWLTEAVPAAWASAPE